MSQLALPLRLDDSAVFESFLGDGNEPLVSLLISLADGQSSGGCWLAGPPAVGKTHLLQAVCARAGDRSAYLPLNLAQDFGTGVLDGLEQREVVCLDDLDAVTGRGDWELALFRLFNAIVADGGRLVVAASTPPREAGIELPDLESRMTQLAVYTVRPLADDRRAAALKLRAAYRGLELPEETARYLLSRSRRDMASLYGLLDTLDRESLAAQRRLTVPFVREILKRRPASV